MKNLKTIFIAIILVLSSTSFIFAQTNKRDEKAVKYIRKYTPLAINNMARFGVPASITMAQGLLESGFGHSELAKKSNNHFGIKCKSHWKGKRVYHDDDEKGECFRKYDNVKDSYLDHGKFLSESPRYASLFKLKYDNYKGWAYGLKKAGYATNPKYPTLLISVIEKYDLHKLDRRGSRKEFLAQYKPAEVDDINNKPNSKPAEITITNDMEVAIFTINGYKVYREGKNQYIYCNGNESYKTLAKKIGLSVRKAKKYNKIDDIDGKTTYRSRFYIKRKR